MSSNHRVVLPWYTQALAFIKLPVNKVTSQNFNISHAVKIVNNFFSKFSHTPEVHVQHTKPFQSRSVSAVCVCAILAVYLALYWQ
jgi:hypothetical protein